MTAASDGGADGRRDAREPVTITPALLREWPLPGPGESKYDRGQVVVVGGDRRSPGAALLAGEAALRVGAGRLTVALAESVAIAAAVALPESGVVPLRETAERQIDGDAIRLAADDLAAADAVLAGPGLDDADQALRLVDRLPDLLGDDTVVVLDAYALGVLPRSSAGDALAGRLVLTPNLGEAERLLAALDQADDGDERDGDGEGDRVGARDPDRYGTGDRDGNGEGERDRNGDGDRDGDGNGEGDRDVGGGGDTSNDGGDSGSEDGRFDRDADLDAAARRLAIAYGAVVSCQGRVAHPDGRLWRTGTGHGGLGTSGSGDVLAGAIAGLCARGVSPEQAAVWATHAHAAAGDRLAVSVGPLGFLARELLAELPRVLVEIG